jgi:hypothetical protein
MDFFPDPVWSVFIKPVLFVEATSGQASLPGSSDPLTVGGMDAPENAVAIDSQSVYRSGLQAEQVARRG